MGEIYLNYSSTSGFSRSNDKAGLTGKILSYADFKEISGDIKPGSPEQYGIIMIATDVQDFIANYEIESVFTEAETK